MLYYFTIRAGVCENFFQKMATTNAAYDNAFDSVRRFDIDSSSSTYDAFNPASNLSKSQSSINNSALHITNPLIPAKETSSTVSAASKRQAQTASTMLIITITIVGFFILIQIPEIAYPTRFCNNLEGGEYKTCKDQVNQRLDSQFTATVGIGWLVILLSLILLYYGYTAAKGFIYAAMLVFIYILLINSQRVATVWQVFLMGTVAIGLLILPKLSSDC